MSTCGRKRTHGTSADPKHRVTASDPKQTFVILWAPSEKVPMSDRDVRLDSHFSLPTDLAAELGTWPEFVSGHEYDADLRSGDEFVSVRLEQDEGTRFV